MGTIEDTCCILHPINKLIKIKEQTSLTVPSMKEKCAGSPFLKKNMPVVHFENMPIIIG